MTVTRSTQTRPKKTRTTGVICRLLLAILICPLAPVAAAKAASAPTPDRESLISAWEALQRKDPQVIAFEKLEPGLYRFQTSRFPFDGKLRVLNVAIDELDGFPDENGGFALGVVEIELLDLPEDFLAKYAQSYGFWYRTNTLYFARQSGRWLSVNEWQETFARQYRGWLRCLGIGGTNWIWWIVLGVFLAFAAILARRTQRQMNRAMAAQDQAISDQKQALERQAYAVQLSEQSLRLGERQNALLEDILAELKKSA